MERTTKQIEHICNQLVNNYIDQHALDVTLDEFQKFYSTLLHLTKTTPVISLVNLEDRVIAQFSNISPQHFMITHDKPLTEKFFEFAPKKQWYGSKSIPENFLVFLYREFKQNFIKLFLILIVSILILFLVDNLALYELISTLLIQSATVFLGLYIIFTVSQNQTLYQDISLFKTGILQKYHRDDQNVTLLGILTVVLTFLSTGIVYLLVKVIENTAPPWLLITSRAIKASVTGIVIMLLFDTFLTVASYYLQRNRDIIERDAATEILNNDYKKNNN